MAPSARARILVSNDDGINAPGIKALIAAIVAADFADVYVCAPSGERSAQSHAITLGRYLSCFPSDSIPGVVEAWAVDGTPADSVMLALYSPCLKNTDFDLMISGINRGDNCGMHVIYSGTVGAAREAACKGVPSVAFSLDNHLARKVDDYQVASTLSVSVIKAMLGLLPGQSSAPASSLKGVVVNVNLPVNGPQRLQGFYLTHQSLSGVFPAFKEIQEPSGLHLAEIDEHTPNSRVFRNYAGPVQQDDAEGGDGWAVSNGFVSVTPLGLRSCIPSRQAFEDVNKVTLDATAAVVVAAANDMGLSAGGVSSSSTKL
mmetsp:Transcript_4900/g.10513  ORF Transcript_4900/g.10513 Transcript_4900/m.10513 type:complete len:316 (-) Transcript_4900:435-1382(-)